MKSARREHIKNEKLDLSEYDVEQRCVYCAQLIQADDDAQRIERKKVAHTACAWRVELIFWGEEVEDVEL